MSQVSCLSEIFLFCNPIAGRGRGVAIARRLSAHLCGRGFAVREFFCPPATLTDHDLPGAMHERTAIVVGGDGTIRAVVQRLLVCCGDVSRLPPLLVVPVGTANLLARHLNLRWDLWNMEEAVVEAIVRKKIVFLDAARANERLFLLVAGVGFDAAVVHELDRRRSGAISLLSYIGPIASVLWRYAYPPLRVEVDGRCVFADEPALVFVGNVSQYGTGFPILIHARADDGLLDVCVLPCSSAGNVLRLAMLALSGDHVHEEGAVYVRGRSIRVDSPQPVPVQVDGETAGHTPLMIQLLQSRLPFIVQ